MTIMRNSKTKITAIFIGTSDFAVPILKLLAQVDYIKLKAVITQPDKEAGRKKILTMPPIKTFVRNNFQFSISDFWLLQPLKIKNRQFIQQLETINPELIIVAAYGQILPKEIVVMPKYGCINIHASLLPKYRGASPIQTAILNGDEETGITIIKIDEGLDTGNIIAQEKIKISKNDNSQTLRDKLSRLGAELLIKILFNYLDGKIRQRPQDDSQATWTKILTKKDGEINFNKTAAEIQRQMLAFIPWPGVYTFFDNKKLQIFKIKTANALRYVRATDMQTAANRKIGKLYKAGGRLMVNCKDDVLVLEEVRLEGKNKISGEEFVNGYLKQTKDF